MWYSVINLIMYPPIETSDRKSSLLMLTDHCLINVFELLELVDFINLAKTSTRMQKIAYNYSIPNSLRNKPIVVTLMRDRYGHGCCNISKNELTGIFSIIGRHVSSIKVNDGDTHILETIRDTCYNLSSIELYDCEDPLQLDLQNLKELKLRGIMGLSAEDFRNCFTNNPGIESLEYDSIFSNDLIELLHMLPRLYSLRLGDVTVSLSLITNLCQLDGITKFSFRSSSNCNSVNILLEELARKWDLLELEFNTEGNARTFDIINKFQNLEVLSVGLINRRFPRVDVYPSNLKCFECDGIRISCNGFLAIVKQLQFLEEFDVGRGCIFSNLNKCKLIYQNDCC